MKRTTHGWGIAQAGSFHCRPVPAPELRASVTTPFTAVFGSRADARAYISDFKKKRAETPSDWKFKLMSPVKVKITVETYE